jgi:hypothetical protein
MQRQISSRYSPGASKQNGYALILMLVLVTMGILYSVVNQFSFASVKWGRVQNTNAALLQAKEALIGDVVSQSPVASAGYLPLPDLGFNVVPTEGNFAPNFSGNNLGYSVAGKLPWKSLGISALRDEHGECLWYVVSGRFKNTPPPGGVVNWDTQGQIDVIDGNGAVIATNMVALIVAPGQVLDGQNRALANLAYAQCGGNYDARNYLDSYAFSDAVSGQLNYFAGSTNNRVALNSSNKQFVMTESDHYNDRFLYVTIDDIFRPIIRRNDFASQVSSLLNDSTLRTHLQSVVISGSKGTGNVNCANTASLLNTTFCTNWKEMMLLTQLPTPAPITIDGAPTSLCSRVLIFAGRKTGAQIRNSATDKSNPVNYLEGPNFAAFNIPTANSANFAGVTAFAWNNPGLDLMRCLP